MNKTGQKKAVAFLNYLAKIIWQFMVHFPFSFYKVNEGLVKLWQRIQIPITFEKDDRRCYKVMYTVKKRLAIFLYPAGISLTRLSLISANFTTLIADIGLVLRLCIGFIWKFWIFWLRLVIEKVLCDVAWIILETGLALRINQGSLKICQAFLFKDDKIRFR